MWSNTWRESHSFIVFSRQYATPLHCKVMNEKVALCVKIIVRILAVFILNLVMSSMFYAPNDMIFKDPSIRVVSYLKNSTTLETQLVDVYTVWTSNILFCTSTLIQGTHFIFGCSFLPSFLHPGDCSYMELICEIVMLLCSEPILASRNIETHIHIILSQNVCPLHDYCLR